MIVKVWYSQKRISITVTVPGDATHEQVINAARRHDASIPAYTRGNEKIVVRSQRPDDNSFINRSPGDKLMGVKEVDIWPK